MSLQIYRIFRLDRKLVEKQLSKYLIATEYQVQRPEFWPQFSPFELVHLRPCYTKLVLPFLKE